MCESLYKELIGALGNVEYGVEKKLQLLALVVPILQKGSLDLKESYSQKIRSLVLPFLSTDNTTAAQQKLAKKFLYCCTNCA